MAVYQRENSYLKILSEREHSIHEIAQKLFISEPTVRRDIKELEKKGIIIHTKGVIKLNIASPDQRIPIFLRELEQTEEKSEMAHIAIKHIRDGYTIMLDASTSAYSIIPHLDKFKNLFVITSGMKSALALTTLGIKCLCTGGEIVPESFSYVGTDAEATLRRYRADVAFFSCRGLSNDGIATDNSIKENSVRRIMIEHSRKKYLLCDKSKFNKTYLNVLCDTKEISGVISNTIKVTSKNSHQTY